MGVFRLQINDEQEILILPEAKQNLQLWEQTSFKIRFASLPNIN